MDKRLINKFNEFFYMYQNLDKYNVIAHCADGDVIIGKDGVNDVTLDVAEEIVNEVMENGKAEIGNEVNKDNVER